MSQEPISSQPNSRLARTFPRAAAAFEKIGRGRVGRTSAAAWKYRRGIFITFGLTYASAIYLTAARDRHLRDYIHDNTYLVWKLHPGAVVETRSRSSLPNLLLAPNPGEETPKVLELFEAIRALKFAQADPRIKGIFADFSSLHVPSSVSPEPLGLAQIEELQMVLHEFRMAKKEQLGDKDAPTAIAWSDSYDSQGAYLLATAFDKVYLQPSGSVPLTGLGAQVTFFRRLLNWAGIKVHAMARKEYKSMVSPFVEEESLPPAQAQNEAELFGELNRSLCHMIGVSRWPEMDADDAEAKVTQLAKDGPYSAKDALNAGLVDGLKYKRELVESLFEESESADQSPPSPQAYGESKLDDERAPKFKSLWDYNRVNNRMLDRNLRDDDIVEVGVVYLNGTIAAGTASAAIKGLNEIADDEDIKSAIIRIDSGGGDVIASDSIWDAVRRVRARKPIVASFGNVAASGGYYAATAANAITAAESTITGSIGVASLRPTITKPFFDRIGIAIQSFATGSSAASVLHEPTTAERQKQERYIDETYDDFLQKVADGRGMTVAEADSLAGGKVYTGLGAFIACNADLEAQVDETEGTRIVVDEAAEAVPGQAVTPKKIHLGDLRHNWTTRDTVTRTGNKLTVIERGPDRAETGTDCTPEPSSDSNSRSATESPAALATARGEADPDNPRKPYGKGLIDLIGGIHDAAMLSLTFALQQESKEKQIEAPEVITADL